MWELVPLTPNIVQGQMYLLFGPVQEFMDPPGEDMRKIHLLNGLLAPFKKIPRYKWLHFISHFTFPPLDQYLSLKHC